MGGLAVDIPKERAREIGKCEVGEFPVQNPEVPFARQEEARPRIVEWKGAEVYV